MPYIPLGETNTDDNLLIPFGRIRSGVVTDQTLILGGEQGVFRSQNYNPTSELGWAFFGDGSASLFDVSLSGDIFSSNWDGTNPASLTTFDTTATAGFYLDSSEGAIQVTGDIFAGGELQFFNISATEADDYWTVNRSSADNFRIQFHESGGSTISRLIIFDEGGIEFYDEVGTKILDYQADADQWRFEHDIAMQRGVDIILAYSDTTKYSGGEEGYSIAVDSAENFKVLADIGSGFEERFRINDEGGIMMNDTSTGAVEVFPKGTLIDMDNVNESSPSAWSSTEAVEQTVTVTCDYASQPVYVQMSVRARFGNNFPDNSDIRIRCGINGSDLSRGQMRTEVVAVSSSGSGTSGSGGTGNTDANSPAMITTVVSSHSHGIDDDPHTHGGPSHTHSTPAHTHDIDSDTLSVVDVLMGYQTTAKVNGDIDLQLLGSLGGAATSETPDFTEISYAVYRR